MSLGKGAAPAAPFSLRSGGNEGGGIETEGLRRAREQRDHARKGMQRWEKMSPKQRQEARALFHVIHRLDPERRKAFLAEWRKMTPQQRDAWLQTHPAPRPKQPPPAQ